MARLALGFGVLLPWIHEGNSLTLRLSRKSCALEIMIGNRLGIFIESAECLGIITISLARNPLFISLSADGKT